MHQTRGESMLITVLGSIEASNSDPIALGGAIQRRLLAALALDAGEVVSLDRLVDISWPAGEAPEHAERNVRTYVHRLRAAFGPDLAGRIETVEPGYRLSLERGELDADRFDELASSAARLASVGDADGALELIDEARSLWHGRAFGEFADEAWAAAEVERLSDVHIGLRELRAELLTEVGRHAEAIRVIEDLITEVPLREHPRALHMQALCGAGRQVDALRAFQDFRSLLIDEVGVEPSAELVELDRAIAAGETTALRPTPATRRVGAYELHDQIGEGAFAVVYRGIQTGLDRPVAIKAIRAELANRPEFIRRFEAEAHMVARLEHPHIVPLYDYWREPDRAYLVMRWLSGGTLEQSLDAGPWSLERTARMVEQIGSALAIAHRAGVVHRDVKPANIVLDDEGNTFLTDFGIALEAEDRIHPEAALSHGSPAYASPEQLRKEPAGPPADIHGLAIAVYEALTSELPFGDSTDPATALRRQLDEPIPRVSELRPGVPAAVDEVLQRAAAKDPRSRYQDVLEFAEAFVGAAAGIGTGTTGRSPTLTVLAGKIENPYKGLRAFDESDADDFFGRERLVDELLGRLNGDDSGSRVLTLVGPSGSGKSSVVRAGLLPALRRGAVPGSDEWFVTTMHPGAHPFEQLESALLRVAINPPASLLDQLSSGPRGILRGVQRALPDDRTRLLVVIDQFEELFTLCADAETRTRFLAGLVAAASEPATPVRFVLTLRADFYDRPLRHPDFATLIKQNSVTVTPLAGDELEHAIVDPAARIGVEFETGLVAEIVAEVAGQPGALPLLQYALTELFEAQVSRLLLLDHYRELGGLTGALARRADELYQSSSPEDRSAIRALFGRLITPGEATEDTRRRIRLSEAMIDEATERVVDTYGSARLLTFDHDPITREPTVEVAHEALIREWPRLRDWLDDDRQGLRIHRHLTTSAAAWVERDRDDSELYRGLRLDAAAEWGETSTPALNPVEAEFLATSVAQRDAEEAAERARVRRLRRLLVITGIVAIVALVAGAIAFRQQQRADDQAALAAENEAQATANAEQAEASATLAAENEAQATASAELADQRAYDAETARLVATAQSLAPTKPRAAMLLAVVARQRAQTPETLGALHAVLSQSDPILGYLGWGRAYIDVVWLSEDRVAGIRSDGVDLFDRASGQVIDSVDLEISTAAAMHDTNALIRRADGGGLDTLAVAGAGTTVHVFAATDSLDLLFETETTAPVRAVDVSPDGRKVVATTTDGTVTAWSTDGVELFTPFHVATDRNLAAQYDAAIDGPLYPRGLFANSFVYVTATAHDDHVHIHSGAANHTIDYDGHPSSAPVYTYSETIGGQVPAVSRSVLHPGSGETIIVGGSAFGRIPQGADTRAIARLTRGEGNGGAVGDTIVHAELGTDGQLVTILDDGTLAWFDLDTGERMASVDLGTGSAGSGATGPNGGTVAAASDRGIVLASLTGRGPLTRDIPRPDGQPQLSVTHDGRYVIFGGSGLPSPVAVFRKYDTGGYRAVDIPVDASIYAGTGPSHPGSPSGFDLLIWGEVVEGVVTGVTHTYLLAGSEPEPVMTTTEVLGLSAGDVDPQGRWIVVNTTTTTDIRVHDTRTGSIVRSLPVPLGASFSANISGIRFHPSGNRLLVSARSGLSEIWDTTTWTVVDQDLTSRQDIALGYWSADGSLLATAASDGKVTIRHGETFEPIRDLVGATGTFNNWAGGPLLFSADNTLLLTDHDNVARLWDVATGKQVGIDMTTSPTTNSGANHGDSLQLVTGGDDVAYVWNLDPDSWAEIACDVAGSNLSADEWAQWGPIDEEHRATCPQFPLT